MPTYRAADVPLRYLDPDCVPLLLISEAAIAHTGTNQGESMPRLARILWAVPRRCAVCRKQRGAWVPDWPVVKRMRLPYRSGLRSNNIPPTLLSAIYMPETARPQLTRPQFLHVTVSSRPSPSCHSKE